MPQIKLKTSFAIIGPETSQKFFPNVWSLPRPGQWIWIESQKLGVERFLAKIASVGIEMVNGVYQVSLEVNRASLTEDILIARLTRAQFDLIERDVEILELLAFSDAITRSENFTITILAEQFGYSGANYSDGEYSQG